MYRTRATILAVLLLTCAGCTPSRAPVPPGTIPSSRSLSQSDLQAGQRAREELIAQFGVYSDSAQERRVQSILSRLLPKDAASEPWNVTLLDHREIVNAAATRGNQLFVWRGMLESVGDDEVLAAVMGHEVAHVLADHVTPTPQESFNRVLSSIAGAATGVAAQRAGVGGQGAEIASRVTSALVQGAVVNPYSQKLELEADTIGMFLMADAGYDPRKALTFWESSRGGGGALAQFFSTHPPSEERIQRLEAHLPRALARYRGQ